MKPLTPSQLAVLAYLKSIAPAAQHKCDIARGMVGRSLAPQQELSVLHRHGKVQFHEAAAGNRATWSWKED